MTVQTAFHFSPSEYHRFLADKTPRRLEYDGGNVTAWQKKFRATLKRLTGFPPGGGKAELNVRSIWKREHELGSIERIVFSSQPFCDVPAYVCLPKNAKPPYVWFICVQGHSSGMHNSISIDREDDGLKPDANALEVDRDFALGCMKRGVAALCIEQRSLGERRELKIEGWPPNTCTHPAMQALELGTTLIAQRVFDVDRAIDYLATRGDADMARVGVMGNSGGGTTSMFAAALLPRLRFSMPSCYFCTFEASIMAMFHCWCNYVPGLLKYGEMAEVLGLFAPRPVVIVAGKKDDIFPIEATRSEFKRLKRIYAAAGAADRCRLVEGDEGHRFYADPAWKLMLREISRG